MSTKKTKKTTKTDRTKTERLFCVEYLKKRRRRKGVEEYLVKWKGWSSRHDTWEPKGNILDKKLFEEFQKRNESGQMLSLLSGRDTKRQKSREKSRRANELTESSSSDSDRNERGKLRLGSIRKKKLHLRSNRLSQHSQKRKLQLRFSAKLSCSSSSTTSKDSKSGIMKMAPSRHLSTRVQSSLCLSDDHAFILDEQEILRTKQKGAEIAGETLNLDIGGKLPESGVLILNVEANKALKSVTNVQDIEAEVATQLTSTSLTTSTEAFYGSGVYQGVCNDSAYSDTSFLTDGDSGLTNNGSQSTGMETMRIDNCHPLISSHGTEKLELNGKSVTEKLLNPIRRGRGRPRGSKNKPKKFLLPFDKIEVRRERELTRITRRQNLQLDSSACSENFKINATSERSNNNTIASRCVGENCRLAEKLSVWVPPACAKMLMENVKITDVTSDSVTVTFKECSSDTGFFHANKY